MLPGRFPGSGAAEPPARDGRRTGREERMGPPKPRPVPQPPPVPPHLDSGPTVTRDGNGDHFRSEFAPETPEGGRSTITRPAVRRASPCHAVSAWAFCRARGPFGLEAPLELAS